MTKNEHVIYCGETRPPSGGGQRCLDLSLHGQSPNAVLKIEDISKRLLTHLDDLLVDLLEIAMYVYAADSAISRGTKSDVRMGKRWRRHLKFKIPVREFELWSSKDIRESLIETLDFLSEDDYAFEFQPIKNPPPQHEYFEFEQEDNAAFQPDEIILFSGGLDSLAGAVETLHSKNKSVALVSHRSAPKIERVQAELVEGLKKRVGSNRLFHIPVRATLQALKSEEGYAPKQVFSVRRPWRCIRPAVSR